MISVNKGYLIFIFCLATVIKSQGQSPSFRTYINTVIPVDHPDPTLTRVGNGPTGVIYNLQWLNLAPKFTFSWAEGTVIWKYKGYYYYSFVKNVAGGQLVIRRIKLTANSVSWEMLGYFYNESDPLKKLAIFTTLNHCSPAIMLDDSTSCIMTQSNAQNQWKRQARQGDISQSKVTNIQGTKITIDVMNLLCLHTYKLP